MHQPWSAHHACVFSFFTILKEHCFMGFISLLNHLLSYKLSLITDWIGVPKHQWSITGYCFLLGSSLISPHSKKQAVAARSITEAENRALADTISELLRSWWLLTNMGVSQISSTSFIAIMEVLSKLHIMMFFMSAQNILQLTITSLDITFAMASFLFDVC